MPEEEPADNSGKSRGRRLTELSEEIETKGIYIAVAGLFLLNSAGAFAASIPAFVFVVLFGAGVLIDAYN